MELLNSVNAGVELVKVAVRIFTEEKQNGSEFVKPFILYPEAVDTPCKVELKEFSETCVKDKLKFAPESLSSFVLAGETSIENPKTKETNHFFVIKLYMKGVAEGYVYTIPFSHDLHLGKLRYVGGDANLFLPYTTLAGEGSSCNVIKMDTVAPYDYRAAFLIGHMDEVRLWIDVEMLICDMFCKLAPDEHHQYELIFEIFKFGSMTNSMQVSFDRLKSYFDKQFSPFFNNVRAELKLENTRVN